MDSVPLGATHRGNVTGTYYKLVEGKPYPYKWCSGSWVQCYAIGLRSGSAIKPKGAINGYYELSLETIMDSFLENNK